MSIQIDRQMVERVALLGRLELSEAEINRFSTQLSAIVGYIEKINVLNTEQVEPLAHCLPVHNVLRDDVPQPSLSNEQALANAPDQTDGYFKVPKILDDNSGA
jgi:aspartyl-tRNA(Asn)/glutamyl-tRNA(Gln) amidotransferase subunit C